MRGSVSIRPEEGRGTQHPGGCGTRPFGREDVGWCEVGGHKVTAGSLPGLVPPAGTGAWICHHGRLDPEHAASLFRITIKGLVCISMIVINGSKGWRLLRACSCRAPCTEAGEGSGSVSLGLVLVTEGRVRKDPPPGRSLPAHPPCPSSTLGSHPGGSPAPVCAQYPPTGEFQGPLYRQEN